MGFHNLGFNDSPKQRSFHCPTHTSFLAAAAAPEDLKPKRILQRSLACVCSSHTTGATRQSACSSLHPLLEGSHPAQRKRFPAAVPVLPLKPPGPTRGWNAFRNPLKKEQSARLARRAWAYNNQVDRNQKRVKPNKRFWQSSILTTNNEPKA